MTSYNLFLTNFHFVRPFWLLAIIVLFLVLWLLKKHQFNQSPWQKFLPPHLSGVLVEGANNTAIATKQPWHERLFLLKPFFIGLLSIIALAGPAWQKLPQPVYQTERGSVLIMDMSYSMYATDIKPNRLTRARFKAIDLLNKINDSDVGLIAYAGDAFVISPLTQDVKNIELLLPSLTPEIMPELGANPYAALTLAHEMLTNAGHLTGDIYWFTDDVDNNEISDLFEWSSKHGHSLNILGVGTQNGAPIKLPSGELLKDNNGAIVVPRLPTQKLQSLASRGQGNYQTISNSDSDIDNLILSFDVLDKDKSKQQQQSQQTGDQWQEQGAWLLLLVLPLTLNYFRRGGAILLLPLTCLPLLLLLSTFVVSPVSYANESSSNSESTPAPSFLQKTWQDLWQTNDQQAQQQYNRENYQGAAQQFENSQWQGSAHYKAGDYEKALEAFTQGEQAASANSLYNQGNALAQMKKYQQAIEAYEQALKKKPDLQDAKDNIEKLKQQQKKEQEKNDQAKDKNDKSKDEKSEEGESENDKSDDKGDKQQDKDSSQQSQDKSDKKQEPQSSEDSTDKSQPKDEQPEQSKGKSDSESDKKQEQQAKQDEKSVEQSKEKTAAQIEGEQQAKEVTQKHQQLLNKVTDDPYLLLRNKMQLEYQKRQQDGVSQGVNQKW